MWGGGKSLHLGNIKQRGVTPDKCFNISPCLIWFKIYFLLLNTFIKISKRECSDDLFRKIMPQIIRLKKPV